MKKIMMLLLIIISVIGFAEMKEKNVKLDQVKQEMKPIVNPVRYLSEGWWIDDDDQMVSFVFIEGDVVESYLFSDMSDEAIKNKIKKLSFCEYKSKEEAIELTSSFRRLSANEVEILKYNIEKGKKISRKKCDNAN